MHRLNEVGVNGEQFAAMGYFKPSVTFGYRYFGQKVAVSADGLTIAVLATENIGSAPPTQTVNVFNRTTTTSRWRAAYRLLPGSGPAGGGLGLGDNLAMSGDGKLIALGMWTENVTGTSTSTPG